MKQEHKQLAETVQHNCHISDARFAGNYTMCVYLLKMREYYRWEKAQGFHDTLGKDSVGNWLTEREQLWENIEQEDFAHIDTGAAVYDPFDSTGINTHLLGKGLVYSAGIGQKSKPHFFLGELEQRRRHNGYSIYISAREYARDLTSPPAMSQHNDIFIRRESFQRMIWEKLETWRWNRPDNAMAKAIHCYDFDNDLEGSLANMTDNELEAAILHEIGEIRAGELLPGWHDLIDHITFTQAEIMARAIRDHLADAICTLPELVRDNNTASIHFYFANLTNMRKHLFPSLLKAYDNWVDSGSTRAISDMIDTSRQHWHELACEMLEIHQQGGENSHQAIEQLVESRIL
jgi:hypothetical protein